MALFVLGAGCTRGCSFVNATKDPCLPPLDADFFTQLQRVQNRKHRSLVTEVMEDVVEIFGQNFDVTMETVFSTLEHTWRMLGTTGDKRAFNRTQMREKRDRLLQALAVVLEDSLAEKAEDQHSRITHRKCNYHAALVRELMRAGDEIISFNYDCVIDDTLKANGNRKWNARYGYGFELGARGSRLRGDSYWQPAEPSDKANSIKLYKLHGSLHFKVQKAGNFQSVTLKQRPYTRQGGDLKFSIIPPESHKAYDKEPFARLWRDAAAAINRATQIVVIGYSLPATDLHSTALFRTSVKKGGLKTVVVVNPDQAARKRCRSILQRGLRKDTRVLSFDKLPHLLAAGRSIWG